MECQVVPSVLRLKIEHILIDKNAEVTKELKLRVLKDSKEYNIHLL